MQVIAISYYQHFHRLLSNFSEKLLSFTFDFRKMKFAFKPEHDERSEQKMFIASTHYLVYTFCLIFLRILIDVLQIASKNIAMIVGIALL